LSHSATFPIAITKPDGFLWQRPCGSSSRPNYQSTRVISYLRNSCRGGGDIFVHCLADDNSPCSPACTSRPAIWHKPNHHQACGIPHHQFVRDGASGQKHVFHSHGALQTASPVPLLCPSMSGRDATCRRHLGRGPAKLQRGEVQTIFSESPGVESSEALPWWTVKVSQQLQMARGPCQGRNSILTNAQTARNLSLAHRHALGAGQPAKEAGRAGGH
jgi:hypothetical protein